MGLACSCVCMQGSMVVVKYSVVEEDEVVLFEEEEVKWCLENCSRSRRWHLRGL